MVQAIEAKLAQKEARELEMVKELE